MKYEYALSYLGSECIFVKLIMLEISAKQNEPIK